MAEPVTVALGPASALLNLATISLVVLRAMSVETADIPGCGRFGRGIYQKQPGACDTRNVPNALDGRGCDSPRAEDQGCNAPAPDRNGCNG